MREADPTARPDPGDHYLTLLFVLLAGYAVSGKGFAYLGVPPLFISEIMLMLGLCFLLWSRCWLALLMTIPSLSILALIGWVLFRTFPFLREFGFDALRDSVLAVYGLYAFIVAALILQKPQRLERIVRTYGRFALFYGFAGGAVAFLTESLGSTLMIGSTPLIYIRTGEAAVHMAGATVFILLGLRRATWLWVVAVLLGFLMISVSRGAMLSFVIPVAAAAVLGGKVRRLVPVLSVILGALVLVVALNLQIETSSGRIIGPAQLVDNVNSLTGRSEVANLDGTKTWRLRWWKSIEDYTLHGPYFWTGKGFGVNLAIADGFVVGAEGGGPPLRAPHNAHFDMLARGGVPGLTLWCLTGASWFAMLLWSLALARSYNDQYWANLFVWIACYGLSIIVDASFDVALEGPMIGIWFWCIIGLGIGTSMIYRAMLAFAPRSTPLGVRAKATLGEVPSIQ